MWLGVAFACTLAACGRIGFDPGTGAGDGVDADVSNPPMTATSCAATGLPATCGPNGNDDCCTTLPVPGGMFFRSYDVGADMMFPTMNAPATVRTFWLDKYEVTVGRYREFVLAGFGMQTSPPDANAGARMLNGNANQGGWQSVWNANLPTDNAVQLDDLACDATYATWTNSVGPNESLPINCVSWYDAMAFCIYDGGFLPTEAEWNYAASGGGQQRVYPWSNPPDMAVVDCQHVNYYNGADYCVNPPTGGAMRVGNHSPLGDARWGHTDMSGNVWEWILDYDAAYATPCDNCAQLSPATNRDMRGGYYKNAMGNMRAANRSSNQPSDRPQYVGVRCARY